MILTKGLAKNGIDDCITSYFPLNADCFENNGKMKKGYEGSKEDFSRFISAYRFTCDNERGFVGTGFDGCLYIVYTGSNDSIDWALNFKMNKVDKHEYNFTPYGSSTGVAMHAGFLDGYMKCRTETHAAVKLFLKNGGREIIVCGHSRGAAIAQCAAVDIQYCYADKNKNGIDITALLYAPPRVFNRAGAESYNRRVPHTYNFQCGDDPVCRVPLDTMGFCDVGEIIKLDKNWYSDISLFRWMPILRLAAVWEHYPMQYKRGIDKLFK